MITSHFDPHAMNVVVNGIHIPELMTILLPESEKQRLTHFVYPDLYVALWLDALNTLFAQHRLFLATRFDRVV